MPFSGTHWYVFTLYALDVMHLEGVGLENFFEVVEAHTIGRAELRGRNGGNQGVGEGDRRPEGEGERASADLLRPAEGTPYRDGILPLSRPFL